MDQARQSQLIAQCLTPLPRSCHDLGECGGTFKACPEDFVVEEIPAYQACGQGEHLFLWVEKIGLSTPALVHELSRALDISPHDIGTAGLKDAVAVTRQFVSVPARCEPRVAEVALKKAKILSATRHGNKLKTGHSKGNRFRLVLHQVTQPHLAPAIAARLNAQGMPNFYGAQRFGFDGETVRIGLDLLLAGEAKTAPGGRSVSRGLRRLALSAVQSALFNQYLIRRLANQQLHTALDGDVFLVRRSGGPFTSTELAREQQRFAAREIVPSGPMFGPKMRQPNAAAQALEQEVLDEAGLSHEHFRGHGHILEGTRRPILVWPEDLTVEPTADGLALSFGLPPGAYATVLLAEFGAESRRDRQDDNADGGTDSYLPG